MLSVWRNHILAPANINAQTTNHKNSDERRWYWLPKVSDAIVIIEKYEDIANFRIDRMTNVSVSEEKICLFRRFKPKGVFVEQDKGVQGKEDRGVHEM